MKIETKYNIGDHVIGIYTNNDEVHLYDDFISWVCFEKDKLSYGLKESCDDFLEENLFLYEDNLGIINKIKEKLEDIRNTTSLEF